MQSNYFMHMKAMTENRFAIQGIPLHIMHKLYKMHTEPQNMAQGAFAPLLQDSIPPYQLEHIPYSSLVLRSSLRRRRYLCLPWPVAMRVLGYSCDFEGESICTYNNQLEYIVLYHSL